MSILSNNNLYLGDNTILYGVPRYIVDANGNAICTHTFSLEHAFDNVKKINNYGLYYRFYKCTGLTSISFPKLTSIGDFGLYAAFQNCSGLTSISFPKLTSIGNMGLSDTFKNCTNLIEIHFRSDARSAIEAAIGYSSKFGASNATIYFDL